MIGVLSGVVVLWGMTEVFLKVYFSGERVWAFYWIYFVVWEVVFTLFVFSLVIIWRIDKNSRKLTYTEISQNDIELSDISEIN